MSLENKLQINVAVLVALGALLLGMGQPSLEGVLLPVLAVFAAVTSVLFTDVYRLFELNRTLANLLAFAAVAYSLSDFYRNDPEQQLLAIANLLIYLQVVLLYQAKSSRVYWQLLVLSLLQVVVASALNLGVLFGVLLGTYLFVALSALTLFYACREIAAFDQVCRLADQQNKPTPKKRKKRRWPLRATASSLTPKPARSPETTAVGWQTVSQVITMGAATLFVAAFLFFSLPRVGDTTWRGPSGAAQRTIGFSETVSLTESGPLRISNRPVLRARLYDYATGRPTLAKSGLYLRGRILVRYSNGQWTQQSMTSETSLVALSSPPSRQGLVRQEYLLEPTNNATLFSVFPAYEEDGVDSLIRYDKNTRQLLRVGQRSAHAPYRYELITDGIRGGSQREFYPLSRPLGLYEFGGLTAGADLDAHTQLCATANQIVRDAGVSPDDQVATIEAVANYLRVDGGFAYSLDPDIVPDASLDPVEDFVANHRTGHCEYFASAMVLMLRHLGIPSRMVLGYYTNEYNSMGGYFQVRDKHAHAWVEAYVEPDQIPDGALLPGEDSSRGAWMRIDPTSTDEQFLLEANVTLWEQIKELGGYCQSLWNDYVLGLDSERQQKAIYDPLTGWVRSFFSAESWKQAGDEMRQELAGHAAPRRITGLIITFIIAGAIATLFVWRWKNVSLGGIRLLRRGSSSAATEEQQDRRAFAFYDRFEALLLSHGMARSPSQTPREFAGFAGGHLAESSEGRSAAHLPRMIVDAFYLVRFGHRTLDKTRVAELEQAIQDLKAALSKSDVETAGSSTAKGSESKRQ
jgi:transglutaminase-like putative cysteine protease